MHQTSAANELADLRAEIARLQRRAAVLASGLQEKRFPDRPPHRPGWPIRREAAELH